MEYGRRVADRVADQQLGYITGKVEEVLELAKGNEARLDALEKNVAEKFTTVETVFRVIKFIGLAVIAVLTFQFGNVTQLWEALIK